MKKLILFLLFFYFVGFVFAENSTIVYSSEDALLAINQSEEVLNELVENNLPYSLVNDSISQAKNVYLQVYYAEILRGTINASLDEKAIARDALRLVNWKNLNYSEVISLTNNVNSIREKTFAVYDLLKLQEKKLSNQISNQTMSYFFMARDSFYEGRLNESQDYIDKFVNSYDLEKGNKFLFKSLAIEARNFFYRYWIQIIILLVILSFFGYFSYVKVRVRILKKNVQRMVSEKATLAELTKKAQTERFKENKISALTYNVRIKSYQERLQKINSSLPVLQARLKKLSKI